MTRGKIVWLESNGDCAYSEEFNGDMATDQYLGELVIEKMKNCHCFDDFKKMVIDLMNMAGYESEDYEDDFLYHDNIIEKNFQNVDKKNNYISKWFSDFLHILNISGKDVVTKDIHGNDVTIKNNYVTSFEFGEKCAENKINSCIETDKTKLVNLRDIVEKNHIKLTKNNDFDLIHSIMDVFDSGVNEIVLKPSTLDKKSVMIDSNCFKSIVCSGVKIKNLTNERQNNEDEEEIRTKIECSYWHFPCPDYKYSNIKRNLEKSIYEIFGVKVEVESFSTDIIDYD